MRELKRCETCPASPELEERFQNHIKVYVNDYIRSGNVMLEEYLILPDGVKHLRMTEKERQRARRSTGIYDRAARNVSLSIMYLSQIESGMDYVNEIRCPQVERSAECPRMNATLTILGNIRNAMLEDIKDEY